MHDNFITFTKNWNHISLQRKHGAYKENIDKIRIFLKFQNLSL